MSAVLPSLWRTRRNSRQPRIHPLEIEEIFENNKLKKTKIEEKAETQENMKLHFQAPPMLVQKFPRQLPTLSTITLLPAPKIRFSKNFVQRRWVYSVVETTSYVKIKKSKTYRKEFCSENDKLKRRNILKKESHLLHKTKTDDKNKKPLSYTRFVQLVFSPTKLLSTLR